MSARQELQRQGLGVGLASHDNPDTPGSTPCESEPLRRLAGLQIQATHVRALLNNLNRGRQSASMEATSYMHRGKSERRRLRPAGRTTRMHASDQLYAWSGPATGRRSDGGGLGARRSYSYKLQTAVAPGDDRGRRAAAPVEGRHQGASSRSHGQAVERLELRFREPETTHCGTGIT